MMKELNSLYIDDLKQICEAIPENMSDFSVLITGATGLIGSLLTDALLYYNSETVKKNQVSVLSRTENNLRRRFHYAEKDKNLTIIAQDICDPIPDTKQFDYIIHLASNADPRSYATYPAETILTNVIGTYRVLEYAKRHPTCKIFLASTMEVYGEVEKTDSIEESRFGLIDFNMVRSGYPESKRAAELLLRSYTEEHKINGAIGRLGYIYGPTMTDTDNKVVSQFIRKAMAADKIVLKSKGQQRRSYCYSADAVAGILTILFKGEKGEAYNIANNDSTITIAEMAEITAGIAGTEVIFEIPDEMERKGYSATRDAVLDETKLRKLGWTPRYNMQDGLIRTIGILKTF